ncbi:TonB-dependent siderophore receptor [Acinetobacter sp. ANC 5054]|uniref:TonB-dependent siderophore receptor n=1 Tax=Acinetobacter sp. ANC 5054 TaxID=1977877 RepID=UPI000A355551|nr:TonB-dependent receptor [Acinetobacter sp. ANC 5054]OTG78440.1 TonB-dependent siderophore receptor [Acinetobacter sp. ANC 5054]
MSKFQVKTTLAIAIRAVLLGAPALTVGVLSTSGYAAAAQNITVKKSTLDQALKQLAIQTGITISYDAQAFSKINSNGLQGQFSPEQALRILLQPANLEAIKLENGGFSIKPLHKAASETQYPQLSTTQASTTSQDTNPSTHEVTQLPAIIVTVNKKSPLTTEGTNSYTAKATAASTGLALSLKETPQLVSVITRQQMEDQNLTQLMDVANQAAGLTIKQGGNIGSDNSPIYARGQTVDSYLLDGIKLLNSYSSIFQSQDTALFDRVEIVRGANGLMTGAGTASASINMVRKKPLKDFKASVSASAGSWDTYRTDLDISTPLNKEGTIRGRTVFAYQTGDSYIDRYSEERKVAYGVVEADLNDNTKASLGVSYQQIDIEGIARSGLPTYYTDGTPIDWSQSDSAAANWSTSDRSTTGYFADIEHQLNDRWKIKGLASRTITSSDEIVGYVFSGSGINKETGAGSVLYGTRWDYKPTQDLFNLTLNGSFDLFNQTHDVVVGTTYAKSKNKRPSSTGWNTSTIDNIFTWDGYTPAKPDLKTNGWYSTDEKSLSAFSAARLKLSDPLAMIIGARFDDWERISKTNPETGGTATNKKQTEKEIIPYIGLTYDFTPHWTAYTSYTTIFSPQDKYDISGNFIDPLVGNSTEIGVKGEFFDNQLNIGAAIYQTKEDNKAILITGAPQITLPNGQKVSPYRAESGTKSRGIELEATGKITDLWQLSASFTRNLSQDSKGDSLNSDVPNNTAKLFTTYTLSQLDEALTIGAGIRWQSDIYTYVKRTNSFKSEQGSYGIVDLMARYKINENLTANLNINNLLNEKYHLSTLNSYYGAPTNFQVGVKYNW